MAKLACNVTGQSAGVCFRLKKKCQPSDSVRRRDTQRAEDFDTRIAQLEGKMETLLAAMQSVVSSPGSSVEIPQILNEENIPPSMSTSKSILVNTTSTNLSFSEGPFPTAPPHINSFSPSHHHSLNSSDISLSEAEECLNFFRSRMLPCFPFINLGPDITAWHLRQDRPFLFQAIVTVTTFSTQKKLAQAEELKRLLFTSALLNVQSNIDLLLGLLTYLAWSTDAFLGRADLVSRLMMLAISLVYDMRLFNRSPPDVEIMMIITQGRADENDQNTSKETAKGFMEKQRAVLACFILSSKCARESLFLSYILTP
ncbi:uncharacterized protein ATNIH1004_007186 [Aspergillus tanneri]|uniref:Transcription factor domain-containing protein n=1 Tax=Aspergillus tanneri TaxID=1220188 RepID=A0A5M9MTC4_9EURO|nr:uncharacterized protein ATNIH1004_007186 [Aspergillus tanneri]KAA8645767.1 hypothetical protein ATNIH1004_007186 [Aspergillus tanneri]